jgi:hypothetical protein
MAAEKSGKKVDRRKTKAPSERSGIVAGYLPKMQASLPIQAMKGLGGRVADLPDNAGLSASEQVGIEMYLKPALEATETIFARRGGKFKDATAAR